MTVMRFEAGNRQFRADFSKPVSLAIPLDFTGSQPSCFDAPPAVSRPLFAGGSCNCEVLTLAPHCNGTHTECVGHVTDERVAIAERLKGGVSLALVITVEPAVAGDLTEDSDPAPVAGDRLVTAAAIAGAFARHPGPAPTALVVRTLRAGEDPLRAYRGPAPAPYLSRQAAAWLVERGIEHLVLDLPSADRAADGGRLTAHRTFFGLPPGSRRASEAMRPDASITELAFIPPGIADGFYLLELQIPPFLTDAAPSRPLLYAVQPE
jgi:kynurenine formamidase